MKNAALAAGIKNAAPWRVMFKGMHGISSKRFKRKWF